MTAPDDTQPPMTSPWVYESGDYQDKMIRISVDFNPVTRALQGATVFRDPECVYTKIYIGLGDDGTPDSTVDSFVIPAGITTIGAAPLRRNQLRTIDHIVALNITAGP